jgi:hypothetical protein
VFPARYGQIKDRMMDNAQNCDGYINTISYITHEFSLELHIYIRIFSVLRSSSAISKAACLSMFPSTGVQTKSDVTICCRHRFNNESLK